MTVPTYDLPQSPILIIGFFGIIFTLVLLYFVNRAYFESPLNRDRRRLTNSQLQFPLLAMNCMKQSNSMTY